MSWTLKKMMTVLCSTRMLGALGAVIVILAAAGPAQAGHRARDPRALISIGHSRPQAGNLGCRSTCEPRRSFAAVEFERGFEKGQSAGFSAGFRDGVNGRCYCDTPNTLACGVSRAYLDGYIDAFGDAYAAGFEQGKRERCCARPRFGCR
jgi:hypothetical protein